MKRERASNRSFSDRPGGMSIVVDSKVSLTHYVRYCALGLTADDEKMLRREVYQSFKNHIDSLNKKKYDTVDGTMDFILMFTPVEHAFTIAANYDQNLRQHAFARNVFVVTPGNFLLVVNMISELWQKDKNQYGSAGYGHQALELYNKLCGFSESFEEVGLALEKASGKYQTSPN